MCDRGNQFIRTKVYYLINYNSYNINGTAAGEDNIVVGTFLAAIVIRISDRNLY